MRGFLLAALVALAATPAAAEDERALAVELEILCLTEAATKVDDGVSDASTVARALITACPREHGYVVDAFSRGANRRTREMIEERFHARRPELALNAVLLARKLAREETAAPNPSIKNPAPN